VEKKLTLEEKRQLNKKTNKELHKKYELDVLENFLFNIFYDASQNTKEKFNKFSIEKKLKFYKSSFLEIHLPIIRTYFESLRYYLCSPHKNFANILLNKSNEKEMKEFRSFIDEHKCKNDKRTLSSLDQFFTIGKSKDLFAEIREFAENLDRKEFSNICEQSKKLQNDLQVVINFFTTVFFSNQIINRYEIFRVKSIFYKKSSRYKADSLKSVKDALNAISDKTDFFSEIQKEFFNGILKFFEGNRDDFKEKDLYETVRVFYFMRNVMFYMLSCLHKVESLSEKHIENFNSEESAIRELYFKKTDNRVDSVDLKSINSCDNETKSENIIEEENQEPQVSEFFLDFYKNIANQYGNHRVRF
jgi:hypothetical protein